MKNRKRGDAEVAEQSAGEDVEAAVRAAARSIAERFEDGYPHFEELARRRGVPERQHTTRRERRRLRDGRAARPRLHSWFLAEMAHRAASLRDDVPAEWVDWAFRRLKQATARELFFLLQAIERHGEPPFIARVLARADDDWDGGWLLEVVTDFVRASGPRGRAADRGRVRPHRQRVGRETRRRRRGRTGGGAAGGDSPRASNSGGNGALGSSSFGRSAGSGNRRPTNRR